MGWSIQSLAAKPMCLLAIDENKQIGWLPDRGARARSAVRLESLTYVDRNHG